MHGATETPDAQISGLLAALIARDVALAASRVELAAERERVVQLTAERDQLRASHERLRLELELLKRRIFLAKAERIDTAQLEMEFAEKLAALDKLAGLGVSAVGESSLPGESAGAGSAAPGTPANKKKTKPTGRRDLSTAALQEERIELKDDVLEKLVAEGKAKRIGEETSYKLAWQRGGMRRLVVARAKYQVLDQQGESAIETAPLPLEALRRSLAAPSLLAHVITDKYSDGLPLNRQENRLEREGFRVDRGTLCRWVEDAGATLGATIVAAARAEAMRTAFCLATDATGISVQPERGKQRQACRRGHYFVIIADKDHIFFEYQPKETSAAVEEMFEGYSGYLQLDAKSVFDRLFRRSEDALPEEDEDSLRHEVGCWSHCRRKFWEAAVAKDVVGREGLARISRLFQLEATWRDKPHAEICRLRAQHLRPHLDAFFEWAEQQYELVRDQRGLLRSAFGYALRQKGALQRFLEDGRLLLENNRSERELRRIAVGRKAFLFVGSDEHAESAGHLYSLIASARLHRLDPEAYLRDVIRVLPHWPRERHLELAPKYWAATRARLDSVQLGRELGDLTVPPPLPS